MYIDTHAHLYLSQFDEDIDQVIQNALAQKVNKVFMPNVDLDTVNAMHRLAEIYPDICFPMMGLHPCSVGEAFESDLAQMEDLFSQRSYIAVGEIGIDLYWDKTFFKQQVEAFKIQVEWAHKWSLPIVIHSRESIDEILAILEEMNLPGLRGVFHCFTGNLEQSQRIIDLGFLMGIGGVVTFKNGGLDKVLPQIGLEWIILETDAPYLAPHPYRGKRNESAYIPIIADKLAILYQVGSMDIAKKTTENALRLFAGVNQPK